MPNNSLGTQAGRFLKTLPQATLRGGGNTAMGMTQMGSEALVNSLPPEAMESAKKVLKKFYTDAATELLQNHPQGTEILTKLIRNGEAEASQATSNQDQVAMNERMGGIGSNIETNPSNTNPQDILNQLLSMSSQNAGQGNVPNIPQPGILNQNQPQVQNDPMQTLQTLISPNQNINNQNINIPKQGLLETNANYQITLDNLLKKQKIMGQEPLQKGEKEKIGLEQDKAIKLELLKQTFSGNISDVQKRQEAQTAFSNDMNTLVEAWDGLGMGKGAVMGRVGGLAGAFGVGREGRARFESVTSGLQFTIAEYITNQSGRALTEKDMERLKGLTKFTPNIRGEDFKGKIQGILDFANSKITAAGGTPQYANAQQLIDSVRGKNKNTQQQGIGKTSSGNTFRKVQ